MKKLNKTLIQNVKENIASAQIFGITIGNEASSSIELEVLDSDEAASFLKISPASLRNMTSSGQIPYSKLGRRNRYLKCDLRALLLANRKGTLWESR